MVSSDARATCASECHPVGSNRLSREKENKRYPVAGGSLDDRKRALLERRADECKLNEIEPAYVIAEPMAENVPDPNGVGVTDVADRGVKPDP